MARNYLWCERTHAHSHSPAPLTAGSLQPPSPVHRPISPPPLPSPVHRHGPQRLGIEALHKRRQVMRAQCPNQRLHGQRPIAVTAHRQLLRGKLLSGTKRRRGSGQGCENRADVRTGLPWRTQGRATSSLINSLHDTLISCPSNDSPRAHSGRGCPARPRHPVGRNAGPAQAHDAGATFCARASAAPLTTDCS